MYTMEMIHEFQEAEHDSRIDREREAVARELIPSDL